MQDTQPTRRPWVKAGKLAKLVHMSVSSIHAFNQLPNCPVVRIGRACRYDVDKYMSWLENDGPAKGRRMLAEQVRREARRSRS